MLSLLFIGSFSPVDFLFLLLLLLLGLPVLFLNFGFLQDYRLFYYFNLLFSFFLFWYFTYCSVAHLSIYLVFWCWSWSSLKMFISFYVQSIILQDCNQIINTNIHPVVYLLLYLISSGKWGVLIIPPIHPFLIKIQILHVGF